MSKPLEVTIHPPIPPEPTEPQTWGDWFVGRVNEEADMARIRFTDAELAAEYHAAEVEAWRDSAICRRSPHTETLEHQSQTLLRFATHPHYFEATEPESDTE